MRHLPLSALGHIRQVAAASATRHANDIIIVFTNMPYEDFKPRVFLSTNTKGGNALRTLPEPSGAAVYSGSSVGLLRREPTGHTH